jgi:hypothetical protein
MQVGCGGKGQRNRMRVMGEDEATGIAPADSSTRLPMLPSLFDSKQNVKDGRAEKLKRLAVKPIASLIYQD